ncbi:MAG: hypothetical protein ACTSUT_08990 [Promethearchaeota archaeon]
MPSSIISEQYFQDYLRMRNEYIDVSEIINRFSFFPSIYL